MTYRLASVLLLSLSVFAWTASDAAAQNAPARPLAPGILTVVPPAPEETETFTKQIPLVELLADASGLDWTPNFIPKSDTLLEKSKAVVLRREIWNLEFAFKPMRRLQVDLPQASGKMQRKNIWYMVYRVKNLGNDLRPKPIKDETYEHVTFGAERVAVDGRRFVPQFVLTGKVLEDKPNGGKQYATREYLDRILPAAQAPIQARETAGRKLYNTVEISRVPIPVSDDQNDRSVWGVVTWEDIDARIDFFSIYIQGLTNAYKFADPAGAYTANASPGTGRRFVYKNLQLNFYRGGDALLQHEEETRYGVRLDANPAEQARVLAMYGLKEPLDHLWVYR